MPIYMDRHDVSEAVTAENVAQLHQADLKIQHKFGCRGLTYWFDEKRKTAFCLIEAPNERAIEEMHSHAHGQVPHRVIEVDTTIVESFLGRIEDPATAQNTHLNIINDPAFRTILALTIRFNSLKNYKSESYNTFQTKYSNFLAGVINRHKGRIANQFETNLIASFESVTEAVTCAFEIQTRYKMMLNEVGLNEFSLKIGLSAGVPVTDKKLIFEDTINLAKRMHHIAKAEIVMTTEVKDLYKSENLNQFINVDKVEVLASDDEHFLTRLFDFIELEWKNNDLNVEVFNKYLGFSKSQLYRKMMALVGESPNNFLMSYRLDRALSLFTKETGNVSEIAFESGFSDPSYFSKCFHRKYSLSPSAYLRNKQD